MSRIGKKEITLNEGIKVNVHREVKGEMGKCTLSKTPTGKYFVSILSEEQYQPNSNNSTIDPSLKSILEGKSRHFRNSKNYFNLPFNSNLKQRAKDLRKQVIYQKLYFGKG